MNEFITDILNKHETKVHELSTPQLEKLVHFIGSLQTTLEETELKEDDSAGEEPKELSELNAELEEVIPLTSAANAQQLLMKKDPEKFGAEDMGKLFGKTRYKLFLFIPLFLGLANIEHKIVKGDVHRVEGNRVYIKIGKEQITEDELYRLITYLDKKIAEPNNLYFNEFEYANGQLSFRISRLDTIRRQNDKRVDSASRVAQAVCKLFL